jgi:ABC-type glutathione transport system ATPase component
MESLAHEGRTMIVVTHEMAFAREAADRVYFMDEGQFVEIGPPEQVISNPRDERTRTFLKRFLHGGGSDRGAPAAEPTEPTEPTEPVAPHVAQGSIELDA